ncbi:MAG: GDSL-type esterase/lipase family protein [Bacteroidia bacterium]|nr:GDSL-type esterase/lipase family protein [Bacteroidia bacterium]
MHKLLFTLFFTVIFAITMVGSLVLFAQTSKIQPTQSVQEFIPGPVYQEYNKIWNADEGMAHFFECLEELMESKRDRVTIVHIGDSHIQADWFSGSVRMSLQQQFGNAGRGLVFPFRQANTNAPPDITSYSNVSWSSRRISSTRSYPPVGISGFGLQTNAPDFRLSLQIVPNNQGLDYSFDRVNFFTDKGPYSYDLWVGESTPQPSAIPSGGSSAGVMKHKIVPGESLASISRQYQCTVEELMAWNGLVDSRIYAGNSLKVSAPNTSQRQAAVVATPAQRDGMQLDLSSRSLVPHFSSMRLPKPVTQITFSGMKSSAAQEHLILYGLVLEKEESPGVLYHGIGANGARVDNYLHSDIFWEQLAALQPDLVIISLGTNETVSSSFRPEIFARKIDQMVHLVRKAAPETSVLLTTPPDALSQRIKANPAMQGASQSLMKLSLDNGYAAWDFLGVMGGSGSIFEWQRHGLAQPDGIHLTKAGYELQASLLHHALMEAYGYYLSHTSR